jgi:murein DD-endopeptidase MepM/ murein hydrolase activator NlpD
MRRLFTLITLTALLLVTGCGAPSVTPVPSYTSRPHTATAPPAPTMTSAPSATTRPQASATAAPPPVTPSPTVTATPAPPQVTFSDDGAHAFPVAGDLDLMTWTHYHWDGSNAVDIEAARHLPGDSVAFQTFIQLPVVAVVSGTVAIADNPAGGLALLLYGEDGYTYYYGHLSEQWVTQDQTVRVGEWLGRIGNTGRWTQYIEPHLHFSSATHKAEDWRWEPDINAAEQFLTWFDLPWQDLDIPDYPAEQVSGWPLAVPAQITRSFAEREAENADQGSMDIAPTVSGTALLPVYATLGGEVNVNRATVMGLRVQITNRPARTTVVYSFMQTSTVTDGDVVRRGDLVGYLDPAGELNYMLFVKDVQIDPAPTLKR